MKLRWVACALLIAGAGPAFAESLGVNVHDGAPELIAAASALGVKWVRLDGNWSDHEPADDQYQWRLDAAVRAARAANLDVFITLAYGPAWIPRHGDTDGQAQNDVPNSSAEWADFVGDAVTHYRALGVRHFGMWNEPNLRGFFEGTPADYASIIATPGAAAVRAACNDCFVLGPELAHVGDADDVLEEILQRVPAGTFDIITHHSYNQFAETGWRVFDGDSFINVLDRQRFTFTRRSLRQLLDAAGYMGEVWITETGYRAQPGNGSDEANQAIYVRRVMEEQLQRAWYTNTFFYEMNDCGVDQSSCTIDGFGLMRPTAGQPGTRQFPAQFRVKPAFTAIQQFIQANPAIVGTQPALQCGDGLDNDGDGRIDLADRGCSGPGDDRESDDPPRAQLFAVELAGALTIDGDLSEYAGAEWLTLGPAAWQGVEPVGVGDHRVRAAVGWKADGLYLAVEVTDDVHAQDHVRSELWQGDSLQLAFDVGQSGGSGYDMVDDHEINFGLTTTGTASFRYVGPAGATDRFRNAIVRSGVITRYEAYLPADVLPGVRWATGTIVGFSFLVNDDDGRGRVGWTEWTPGIGVTKEPELFGELVLVQPGPRDAGVAEDAAPMVPEAGAPPSADAMADADAGAPPPDDAALALDAPVVAADGGVAASDASAAGDGALAVAEPEGCGCATSPGGSPRALIALAAAVLLVHRRRRSKSKS